MLLCLHIVSIVEESHTFDAIDSDPGMSDHISVLCLHIVFIVEESHTFDAIDSDPGMSDRISVLCPVTCKLELKEGTQVKILHRC